MKPLSDLPKLLIGEIGRNTGIVTENEWDTLKKLEIDTNNLPLNFLIKYRIQTTFL